MDSQLQRLIEQKKIPLRGSSSLERFSDKEQHYLIEHVFPHVHLTTNQIIRLTEWLSDLKKLNKTALEDVIKAIPIQGVLSNPRLDFRAKGERLFEAIRALRFPNVTQLHRTQGASLETLL